jgi:hypothetical protein
MDTYWLRQTPPERTIMLAVDEKKASPISFRPQKRLGWLTVARQTPH